MKRIPNRSLTLQEYELIAYNSEFFQGSEGLICLSDKPNSLFKFFTEIDSKKTVYMPENKLRKIEKQYQSPLEYSVQPISIVTIGEKIIGYEMTFDPEEKSLASFRPPREEMIHYLFQLKKALEYYSSKKIIYGDIADRNILVNRRTGQVKFCDMDNIAMGENPIDLISYDLECYQNEHGSIDEMSHAYFHNLLSIQQLLMNDASFQTIIYKLCTRKRPKGFKRTAYSTLDSMVPASEFNGEYIIPHVKEKVLPRFEHRRIWK